jgi:hypothetical protein
MKNKFTKAIKLRDLKDNKQQFKLQVRNDAAVYTVQTHEGSTVLFTAVKSGKTYRRKGNTIGFIER